MTSVKLPLARPLGVLQIPEQLLQAATAEAAFFWGRQVDSGFSEQVETGVVPDVVADRGWQPTAALAELGLAASEDHEWVMTADVDEHDDHAWGLTLLWVLVNPGLAFWQQGRGKHVPAVGSWLIFDDRVLHRVSPARDTPDNGVFLAWAVRLESTARSC
jgi:hypothetical protein